MRIVCDSGLWLGLRSALGLGSGKVRIRGMVRVRVRVRVRVGGSVRDEEYGSG